MEIKNAEAAIEAILFAYGDAVDVSKIAKAIGQDVETTKKILHHMMDRYEEEDRGIRIIELEKSFQMCTKQECYEYLINMALQPHKAHLTEVMLETLSIVAYKQPVTKAEIEKIRGVSCEHAVNRLLDFELITEVGRKDAPGRPILFGTTEQFLRSFGVKSLTELPELNPDRMAQFREEAEKEVQLKLDI